MGEHQLPLILATRALIATRLFCPATAIATITFAFASRTCNQFADAFRTHLLSGS